jgi:hypothetical protein
MREEELRSRLQTLATARRVAPEPAAIDTIRRRARRKVQGETVLVLVALLLRPIPWSAGPGNERPAQSWSAAAFSAGVSGAACRLATQDRAKILR